MAMSETRKKDSGCKKGSSRCLKLMSKAKLGKDGCPGFEEGICLSRRSYKTNIPNNSGKHQVPISPPY